MNDKISQLPKPIRPKQTAESARSLLAGVADALNGPAPAQDTAEPERYIRLPLSQIQIYEKNPRAARNTQFDEIKEALRSEGLGKVLLHVTKRPGEAVYTLSFGGGTRFRAIQELYQETEEERFATVRCLVQPFSSDIALQANHLIENNQRGEMTFWDNARAFLSLYQELEISQGGNLSGKEFISRCAELGLRINATNFVYYTFATSQFSTFQFAPELTRSAVEKIQPWFAAYERLAALKGNLGWRATITPVMERLDQVWAGRTFELHNFLKGTDLAMSGALGISPAEMPKAIEYSKDKYTTTWDKLLGRLRPTAGAVQRPAVSPTVPVSITPQSVAPAVDIRARAQAPLEFVVPDRLFSSIPASDLLKHIESLVLQVCERIGIADCVTPLDCGLGWYMEPYLDESVLDEVQSRVIRMRLCVWSVLSQWSGQWHADMIAALPTTSVWRAVMTKQPGVSTFVRSAVAAVPSAHIAFADWFIGNTPWGSRQYFFEELLNKPHELEIHDEMAELLVCIMRLMRLAPERFAHIRFMATGNPRRVQGAWE